MRNCDSAIQVEQSIAGANKHGMDRERIKEKQSKVAEKLR